MKPARPPFYFEDSHVVTMECERCNRCYSVPVGDADRAQCYCGRDLRKWSERETAH